MMVQTLAFALSTHKDGHANADDDGVVLSGDFGSFVHGSFVLDRENLMGAYRYTL